MSTPVLSLVIFTMHLVHCTIVAVLLMAFSLRLSKSYSVKAVPLHDHLRSAAAYFVYTVQR